jgi:hypothetical protein
MYYIKLITIYVLHCILLFYFILFICFHSAKLKMRQISLLDSFIKRQKDSKN